MSAERSSSDNTLARWVREFQEEGFTRLGRVASDEELDGLSRRIDSIMEGEVRYEDLLMQLDPSAFPEGSEGRRSGVDPSTPGFKGATHAYRKIQRLELDPVFRSFMQHPTFYTLAKAVIGERVSVVRAMFMNKPAHGGTDLGWHQDFVEPEWRHPTVPIMTFWTAIDPATIANGCVQVVPRTHTRAIGGDRDFLSDAEAAIYCKPEDRVFLELEPGETVLLHSWTVHKSDPNTTGIPRRGYSFTYGHENARLAGKTPFPLILPEYNPAEERDVAGLQA
jgi:hypothetical protein